MTIDWFLDEFSITPAMTAWSRQFAIHMAIMEMAKEAICLTDAEAIEVVALSVCAAGLSADSIIRG